MAGAFSPFNRRGAAARATAGRLGGAEGTAGLAGRAGLRGRRFSVSTSSLGASISSSPLPSLFLDSSGFGGPPLAFGDDFGAGRNILLKSEPSSAPSDPRTMVAGLWSDG